MSTATLIDQFQPNLPRGGVCATGEIITISGEVSSFTYGQNRFTVFDPTSETSELYEMTLPFTHQYASPGCPFDGGVAVVAKANSGDAYLLIMYPDGTYDVYTVGTWPTGDAVGCGPVDLGGDKIAMWARYTGYASRMLDRSGTPTWSNWPSVKCNVQPQVWGGKVWTSDDSNVYGRSLVDGSVITTLPGTLEGSPSVVKDGVLWARSSSAAISGVDLTTNVRYLLSIPNESSEGIAVGAGKLWFANSAAIYASDGASLETYSHANKGASGSVHFSNGCAWAMHATPTS